MTLPQDHRWNLVPVWGIYLKADDVTPIAGSIRLTLSQRITRVDGRVIYPEGAVVERTIGDTSSDPATRDAVRAAWRAADQAEQGAAFDGVAWDARWNTMMAGAVFASFPASDDPDIVQTGYQVKVEERLSSQSGKTYYIEPKLGHLTLTPPGINLGTVEVPPGPPGTVQPVYAKGLPGGVASLDDQGRVPLAQAPTGLMTAEELPDEMAVVLGGQNDFVTALAELLATVTVRGEDVVGGVLAESLIPDTIARDSELQAIVGGAPSALNTLAELAAAINNDPAFAGTVTDALNQRYLKSDVLNYASLPAGSTVTVSKVADTWPARPTSRADIVIIWKGADPSPLIVTSGTGGMRDNIDLRFVTP